MRFIHRATAAHLAILLLTVIVGGCAAAPSPSGASSDVRSNAIIGGHRLVSTRLRRRRPRPPNPRHVPMPVSPAPWLR